MYLNAHNIFIDYFSDIDKELALDVFESCVILHDCKIKGISTSGLEYPDLIIRYCGAHKNRFDNIRSAHAFKYFKYFIEQATDTSILDILQDGLDLKTKNGRYLECIISEQKNKIQCNTWTKPDIKLQH